MSGFCSSLAFFQAIRSFFHTGFSSFFLYLLVQYLILPFQAPGSIPAFGVQFDAFIQWSVLFFSLQVNLQELFRRKIVVVSS